MVREGLTFGYPKSIPKFKGHNHCTFFENALRHLMCLNKSNGCEDVVSNSPPSEPDTDEKKFLPL